MNFKIGFIILFLTFLCIVSCSKSQKENLLTVTSEFKSDTEEDLSDSNVSLPFILFSNRELSGEITTTEGTLHFPDGEETTLEEYSVSCLYGKLDKVKGEKRNIVNNTFTYTISGDMEEDIITIQVFGEDGYRATNYVYVTKGINEKGIPVFILKKNSTGIGNTEN